MLSAKIWSSSPKFKSMSRSQTIGAKEFFFLRVKVVKEVGLFLMQYVSHFASKIYEPCGFFEAILPISFCPASSVWLFLTPVHLT